MAHNVRGKKILISEFDLSKSEFIYLHNTPVIGSHHSYIFQILTYFVHWIQRKYDVKDRHECDPIRDSDAVFYSRKEL